MNTTARLITTAQGNGNIAVVAQATDSGTVVIIDADGGTRRERGARLAAAVRRMKAAGMTVERIYIGYDEFYGFQTRTTARYRVTSAA